MPVFRRGSNAVLQHSGTHHTQTPSFGCGIELCPTVQVSQCHPLNSPETWFTLKCTRLIPTPCKSTTHPQTLRTEVAKCLTIQCRCILLNPRKYIRYACNPAKQQSVSKNTLPKRQSQCPSQCSPSLHIYTPHSSLPPPLYMCPSNPVLASAGHPRTKSMPGIKLQEPTSVSEVWGDNQRGKRTWHPG